MTQSAEGTWHHWVANTVPVALTACQNTLSSCHLFIYSSSTSSFTLSSLHICLLIQSGHSLPCLPYSASYLLSALGSQPQVENCPYIACPPCTSGNLASWPVYFWCPVNANELSINVRGSINLRHSHCTDMFFLHWYQLECCINDLVWSKKR